MMTNQKILIKTFAELSSIFYLGIIQSAHATEKDQPLWQLGFGGGGLNQSYYTGTNQTRRFLFPVVVPIVRGKIFKSDDRGARAELFNSEQVKLNFSMDFNLAIDSEEIELRQGMPDIANNLQIGPSIEWKLFENKPTKSQGHTWLLNFPLRANIGFDDDGVDFAGYVFSPNVEYNYEFIAAKRPWRFGASLGPQLANSDYNDIYYAVDEEFAIASRLAYQSESGFAGYRLQTSLVMKDKQHLFLIFLRYENIANAVFNDSPLVETNDNLVAGFIYNHYLFNSKKRVNR